MYDLAIIGAGAGGIAAAKLALKSGMKTVLIDKTPDDFGGTCVNRGCIPTKFFLNSAKQGKAWGDIFASKSQLVDKIKLPLLKYLSTQGVDMRWGEAKFIDKHSVMLGEEKVEAKSFIIAAGSKGRKFFDHPRALFAEEIFSLSQIPKTILVVGGGYIGVEIASLLNSLGVDVTIVEKEERILPGFDARLSNRFRIILETKGIKVNAGKTVEAFDLDSFDLLVLALGRQPDMGSLALEKAGVNIDERGWVLTDKYMRSNIDNIYACGDCTGKKMLAYTAEYQAAICVKNIQRGVVGALTPEDYPAMATCVFSFPQIAHVGLNEEEAKIKGIEYRVIKTNFLKFSSAYVYNDTDGYIQVLVASDGGVLGADIISNHAGELISIITVAIAGKMNIKQLAECLLVHPTLSEIIPLTLRDDY